MAFLATASAPRAPIAVVSSSRRRAVLAAAIKATAGSTPHPVLSSLRLAASAAVLLAATTPAIACTPAPPPPPPSLTTTVSSDEAVTDDSQSHPFEKLIVETAALASFGGADAARARLSSAVVGADGEQYTRLLAAQELFVDGKVDEAIAAFEELAREEPGDYRPLFCQSVLYFVLGRNSESESMLQRCRELAGDDFGGDLVMPVSPVDSEAAGAESESPEAETEKL
uniref:Uncharacterized protein n=1 Tax=Leersia perrieri TaxID=77586 RepID=A0A0D9VJK2_9ORYZ